jgi:hypothetical protein
MRPTRWLSLFALCATGCGSSEKAEERVPLGPTDVVVPAETADELALERLGDWNALPVFRPERYRQYSSYDRETTETTLPLLANGNRDMNHFVCRSADAQMEASLVEPVFDLETCPEDYVHGLVLARAEGPGRLSRFQLTMLSLRLAPADDEILRIYVDDVAEPFVQVPLAGVLDGSASEIFAPPFGRGSSQQLAWYYPVSFEQRLVVALDRVGPLDLVYYQINVAQNAAHERAAPKRSPARDVAKALLSEGPPGEIEDLIAPVSLTLAPGETLPVTTLAGPGTIHEIAVTVSRAELPLLDDITLSVTWDGASDPAIEVPLSFLYVSSFAEPSQKSLALSASGDTDVVSLELRLPMPFAASAEFSLSSSASSPVALEVALQGDGQLPSEPFGKLFAEIHTTTGPTLDSHHPVVSTAGPGRHVGTCLMLEGHGATSGTLASPLNFLEGDFRGVIDGALDLRDTGTEDYLNGSFYFESGPFGFPFGQAWDISAEGPSGRVSACRWHVLTDAIDYDTSFELDLEIGPADPSLLDRYRSIGFGYR